MKKIMKKAFVFMFVSLVLFNCSEGTMDETTLFLNNQKTIKDFNNKCLSLLNQFRRGYVSEDIFLDSLRHNSLQTMSQLQIDLDYGSKEFSSAPEINKSKKINGPIIGSNFNDLFNKPEKTLETVLQTDIETMLAVIKNNSTNAFYNICYIISNTGRMPLTHNQIIENNELTNYEKILLIKTSTSFMQAVLDSELSSLTESEVSTVKLNANNKPLTKEQKQKLQLCKDDYQFEVTQCNVLYQLASLFLGVLGLKSGLSEIGWGALGVDKGLSVAQYACKKNAKHNYEMCLLNNDIPLNHK